MSLTNKIVGTVHCDTEGCYESAEMEGLTAYQLIKHLSSRDAQPMKSRRWTIRPAITDRTLPWFERHGVKHICPTCSNRAERAAARARRNTLVNARTPIGA